MASWAYVFGALSIGAFAVVLLSGAVLAVEGPAWWHKSNVGLFVNSMHLWSTELFFMFMVVHLWVKFFMAAWRGKRKATWITGVLAFVISIATAFTGYLSQQNFDSEWIGTQAKDGINSTGAGAFWNVLNFGQMLMWHIVLLPLVVVVLIGLHVLLVRRRGVVPPFAPTEASSPGRASSAAPPSPSRRPPWQATEFAVALPQEVSLPSETPPAAVAQAPAPPLPPPVADQVPPEKPPPSDGRRRRASAARLVVAAARGPVMSGHRTPARGRTASAASGPTVTSSSGEGAYRRYDVAKEVLRLLPRRARARRRLCRRLLVPGRPTRDGQVVVERGARWTSPRRR